MPVVPASHPTRMETATIGVDTTLVDVRQPMDPTAQKLPGTFSIGTTEHLLVRQCNLANPVASVGRMGSKDEPVLLLNPSFTWPAAGYEYFSSELLLEVAQRYLGSVCVGDYGTAGSSGTWRSDNSTLKCAFSGALSRGGTVSFRRKEGRAP